MFDSEYSTSAAPGGPFKSDCRTTITLRATIDPLRRTLDSLAGAFDDVRWTDDGEHAETPTACVVMNVATHVPGNPRRSVSPRLSVSPFQSNARSAPTGSTFDARRADTLHAAVATSNSTADTPTKSAPPHPATVPSSCRLGARLRRLLATCLSAARPARLPCRLL